MKIWRGCQASTVDELFGEANETTPAAGMLSMTCTTDLCNGVDINQLTRSNTRRNSAAGI